MSDADVLGDVLVYGSTLWHSPSLTEHHLARALARRTRVAFLEPPLSVVWPLRANSLRGKVEAASHLARRATHDDGVDVVRLLTIPPIQGNNARRASAPWIRHQISAAVSRLGLRTGTILATRTIREGAPTLPTHPLTVAVVKDWLQAGGHLTGLDADTLRARELSMWRSADLVCAVSEPLRARLAEDGVSAKLLRHGFVGGPREARPNRRTPLDDLPGPILGCAGRIDARWAFDELERIADEFASGSVVLVGPISTRAPHAALTSLLAKPNVHHFQAVSGDDLQSWLAAMDCCLIPYIADDWQRFASPIKVWDYLYSGRPIVATGSPALGAFPPGLMYFQLDETALPALVHKALNEEQGTWSAARRDYALANTWDDRVDELVAMLREARGNSTERDV